MNRIVPRQDFRAADSSDVHPTASTQKSIAQSRFQRQFTKHRLANLPWRALGHPWSEWFWEKLFLLDALTGYLLFGFGKIFVPGKMFGRPDWRDLRKRIGIVSSAIRQQLGYYQLKIGNRLPP